MQLVAMLGTAIFVVVGTLVGARMLMLARRTRELPEICVGGALFLYAAVGQPCIVASRPLGAAFGYEARLIAVALGLVANVGAVIGMWTFTWCVYRRDSRLAGAAVWLAGLAAIACAVAVIATLPVEVGRLTETTRLGIEGLSVALGIGMAWTAWESLRYYGLMRRRLALGLAQPVVVNRFLLWGCGCGVSALSSVAMIALVAAGFDVVAHPAPLLMISFVGTTIGICWYLTFLPPAGYLRWVGGLTAVQEG